MRMTINIKQLFDKAIQATVENADYDYVITVEDSRDDTRWLQITWDTVNVYYPFTETPDQVLSQLGLELPDGMGVSDWAAMKNLTLWHSATNLEIMAAFVRAYLIKAFGMSTNGEGWQIKEITG